MTADYFMMCDTCGVVMRHMDFHKHRACQCWERVTKTLRSRGPRQHANAWRTQNHGKARRWQVLVRHQDALEAVMALGGWDGACGSPCAA